MSWQQSGRVYGALRRAKGLKQREVADELGFEQAWVSQIENGRRALPAAWSAVQERRVYEEEPQWWDQQPVDRTLWDSLLALGEPEGGEAFPCYAVGVMEGKDLPLLAEPLVATPDRDAADAAAERLALGGIDGTAVVPLWLSGLRERDGTVLDGSREDVVRALVASAGRT